MKILIDGKELTVSESASNIVEAARENGIVIPAPCYRSDRVGGCCKGCLILVNGQEAYACGTRPQDGMEIVFHTPELKKERTKRIDAYVKYLMSTVPQMG